MREKLAMDFGWRFHLDNLERPIPKNMMYYYLHTKAERARGPAAPSFYDGDWEVIDLPHDYAIAGGVDYSSSDTEGFVPRSNAWYRRLFSLSPEDRGKRIVLQFDGVVTHCKVWVNGHQLYRNFCGYTSFQVDITEFVDYGDMLNQVSVYVDTSDFEGWWYEGAGIYRHVWLIKTAPVCVETWGTYADAKRLDEERWKVRAEAEIRSIEYQETEVVVCQEILNPAGKIVVFGRQKLAAHPRCCTRSEIELTIKNPALWSCEEPNLYTLRTVIEQNGEEIDSYDTVFGFRTIEYTMEGVFLNGKHVKFKGVCAHEDHANLGVAVPDDVREHRMKMLKFIGCNAYRCSHNPPTPEVLALCDRLGILVMDENRWFDCSEEGLDQLEHMMKRDRNHPSIVMWSMANEEPIQGTQRGQKIMRSMMFTARKYDDYRPFMMAMSGECQNADGVAGVSDVIGINYLMEQFDEIHARFPNTPLVASEIGGKMLPYGVMGDGSGEDWEAVDKRPWFCGMFKWIAFGYRGESRGWPRLFSRSGIIEPTAVPKENTWFYKQMWDEEDAFVKICPFHWNWEGKEGETIEVKIYSNAEEIALYQDGKLLECKKINRYRRTVFRVTYQPGFLKAVALRGKKEWAEDIIETTGKPVSICLEATQTRMRADRTNTCIVDVYVRDAQGRKAMWATDTLQFHLEGSATLLAVSNNDPYDPLGATVPERKLFGGHCQVIFRSTTEPGEIRLTARACGQSEWERGMEPVELIIPSVVCTRAPHVPLELDTDAMCYFAKMDGPH